MLGSPLHENSWLRYQVEIQDVPMLKCEQTAFISFFDDNNKKVVTHKFGVISKEVIYEWIDKGETINISGAYVKDFSLVEYRTNKGFDDHKEIQLNEFKARKTFFDCEYSTDFSFADFVGDKVNFEACIFANGFVNFLNARFGTGDVSFKKSKFGSGSTSFRSVKFGEGLISFNNASFGSGDLSFVDSDFGKGDVDFKTTYFGEGTVDFKFSKFSNGDISFEKALFGNGKKDFKNVEFGGGKVDFRRIEFNDGDVSFEGVEFGDGKVSFRSSIFGHGHKIFDQADFGGGEVQFDKVEFGTGTVSFNQASAMKFSFLECHLNCYVDLTFNSCELVDLRNTIVRDIVDVKSDGSKVAIKEMNLANMRILGRLFINWRENDVYDLIYNQKDTDFYQKAEQFRILKENFRNNGQYVDEDMAYLEFKRCEATANLLSDTLDKSSANKLKAKMAYKFQQYVFDYVGRYGTEPTRVLYNMVIIYTIFSFIYYASSEYTPGFGQIETGLGNPELHTLKTAFYYSAITFFTIGYGDYFPGGYLKIVAVLEGFCGVFLMSYFTVAFARRILR